MPKEIIDSYTQAPIALEYTSKIPGIQKGRSLFKPAPWKCSAEYHALPHEGAYAVARNGDLLLTGDPAVPLFGSFSTPEIAAAVVDYLVQNDASVSICLYWATKQDLEPMFRLLEWIMELTLTLEMGCDPGQANLLELGEVPRPPSDYLGGSGFRYPRQELELPVDSHPGAADLVPPDPAEQGLD